MSFEGLGDSNASLEKNVEVHDHVNGVNDLYELIESLLRENGAMS